MKDEEVKSLLSRRRLMAWTAWTAWAAGALAVGAMPLQGWADDDGDEDDEDDSGSGTIALAQTGIVGKNVVVVGGGMAGMTAAKYLRLWGGAGVQVTLVEPDALYTSSIMSNLVLNGSRSVASLRYSRDALAAHYGVVIKSGRVVSVRPAARTVKLADGTVLGYDHLVLAPGVSFDDAYGLKQADYARRTPHAWRAGWQTSLLRKQLVAMRNGDTFVMTIPKAPYRCPPGPYERACVVADYLKTAKGAGCKVLVLDENLDIQAEKHTFETAFSQIHAGVIRYVPGVTGIAIDPVTKVVSYDDLVDGATVVQAQVVNPIAPHRAAGSAPGGWLARAGLNNGSGGRWATVDPLSYASTAAGAEGIHIIGDAANCGLPKAGHVANQEAKICADAIVRLFLGGQPDPQPVANSACYSPITAKTASWLTAVYQYDATAGGMKVASNGGQTVVNGLPAKATESAAINGDNFKDMGIWFKTLMRDTTS